MLLGRLILHHPPLVRATAEVTLSEMEAARAPVPSHFPLYLPPCLPPPRPPLPSSPTNPSSNTSSPATSPSPTSSSTSPPSPHAGGNSCNPNPPSTSPFPLHLPCLPPPSSPPQGASLPTSHLCVGLGCSTSCRSPFLPPSSMTSTWRLPLPPLRPL